MLPRGMLCAVSALKAVILDRGIEAEDGKKDGLNTVHSSPACPRDSGSSSSPTTECPGKFVHAACRSVRWSPKAGRFFHHWDRESYLQPIRSVPLPPVPKLSSCCIGPCAWQHPPSRQSDRKQTARSPICEERAYQPSRCRRPAMLRPSRVRLARAREQHRGRPCGADG